MRLTRLRLAVTLAIAGCAAPEVPDGAAGSDDAIVTSVDPVLVAALAGGEEVDAIVALEATHVGSVDAVEALSARGDVLAEAASLHVVSVRLRSMSDLDALAQDGAVQRVEAIRYLERHDIPSLAQIGQPAALARGATGRGTSVAVLDTGADPRVPELGGCVLVGPDCGVIAAMDFAPEDGVFDDLVRHGTNVASIVRLVAPETRIVALDVFDGDLASSFDIVRAIDWILEHRDEHSIVAANFSLGHGTFSAPCPEQVLAIAMQRLRDGGVLPIVSSGNDGATGAIASPGCGPAAVSVGAVDADDALAPFSNVASFMTLAAPGVAIQAGGVWMSGTSQAAPHVSGSVAALQSVRPADGPDALEARLVDRAVGIHDARSGLDVRRVDLDGATAPDDPPPPPPPPVGDVYPPVGVVQLAGGASITRDRRVPMWVRAFDLSGLDAMCVSITSSCSAWQRFTTRTSVTAPGRGTLVVRVWLRDRVGNVTDRPITQTIIVTR